MERIAILQMGGFLLVTIQVDMHDQLAMALQDDLTTMIEKTGAKGVLIDISALEMVDSFIGRMIANISGMASILDARTVLVGMQPAVAITLVELGLSLPESRRHSMSNVACIICARSWQTRGPAMSVIKTETIPIRAEQDIVQSRQIVRKLSQEIGLSLADQTKMVTAASELARNTLIHGKGGEMTWEVLLDGVRKGLRLDLRRHRPRHRQYGTGHDGRLDLGRRTRDGFVGGQAIGE